MFSVTTISLVICLSAMLHMSDGKKKYGPKKNKYLEEDKYPHVLPVTEDDKTEIANAHNDLRRNVWPSAANMYKIVWNEEAAFNAMKHAAKCVKGHSDIKCREITRPAPYSCGENMFFSSAITPWTEVIQDWDSEKEDFTYGVGGGFKTVGHYTQVAWWNSVYVGCGAAKCDNLKYPYVYVCHYCPIGNDYDTQNKPYLKGRWCSKCSNKETCEDKLCVK
ncbi:allurin-like [Dendropsophus ebraccatus]|uniref:allurin-like n=1 Tax=Dendropsophus ebraccatus TaxID=150705 RepID=UPI003831F31F